MDKGPDGTDSCEPLVAMGTARGYMVTADNTVTPLLLRVADVAQLLGVHERTVRKLVDASVLASVRVGSHALRIPRIAVDRFIEGGGTGTPS